MHKHSDVVHIFTQLVAGGVLADQVSLKGLATHWAMDVDMQQVGEVLRYLPIARVVCVSPAASHVVRTYFSYSCRR